MSDFDQYQSAHSKMRVLIRTGRYCSPEFQVAWETAQAIKNKHGGFPPAPDDYEDREQAECEDANMRGTR